MADSSCSWTQKDRGGNWEIKIKSERQGRYNSCNIIGYSYSYWLAELQLELKKKEDEIQKLKSSLKEHEGIIYISEFKGCFRC